MQPLRTIRTKPTRAGLPKKTCPCGFVTRPLPVVGRTTCGGASGRRKRHQQRAAGSGHRQPVRPWAGAGREGRAGRTPAKRSTPAQERRPPRKLSKISLRGAKNDGVGEWIGGKPSAKIHTQSEPARVGKKNLHLLAAICSQESRFVSIEGSKGLVNGYGIPPTGRRTGRRGSHPTPQRSSFFVAKRFLRASKPLLPPISSLPFVWLLPIRSRTISRN